MLRNRLITAVVLIPLVVAGILLIPSDVFALLIGVFVLLGAREWARLGGARGAVQQGLFALLVGGVLAAVYFLPEPAMARPLQWLVAIAWLPLTAWLVLRRTPVEPVAGLRPGVLLAGVLVLAVAWYSIWLLHQGPEHGPALVLFLFVLIWVADSGAYFAGRAWGRRKLSPQVSPGKTWAGAGGALAGALVCALVLHQLAMVNVGVAALIGLCLLVTAVSIGGDLFESLLKRQAQLKDSGNLLPGHGGALDRIDSLLAAAPVFAVGLSLLERIA